MFLANVNTKVLTDTWKLKYDRISQNWPKIILNQTIKIK